MLNHGLNKEQLSTIKNILKPWAGQIECVALFGSRATGKYRDNSDIDLVLYGNIDEKTIDRLWTLFHDSDLPYKVDVAAYHLVDYSPFKRHMDEVKQILFTQRELIN